jgi:16S rRNA (cytosine967-C5)-methyltransferase
MKAMVIAISNPRDLAVLALRDRDGNVSASIERRVAAAGLSPADGHLARELALGVERRRASLEAIACGYLVQPGRNLPGALNQIIAVAIYQLLYLDRIPAFAAVNEAVEQAERFHHRRQSGLVNGLLRTILRKVSDVQHGPVPAARDVIPIGPDSYRRSEAPVFPDPAASPAAYLAAAYSLPMELSERWIANLGSLDKAAAVAAQANVRAPLIVRVNSARATVQAVLAELAAAGVAARAHENGLSIVLDDTRDVTSLEAFARGAFQPQDPTATGVVLACGVRPGMKVLDLCAAPGTKTTHLAELMGNQGCIVAADVSQEKLDLIAENCRRMGITIVQPILADGVGSLESGGFDLVLADVPCSNTGVLARRAEARWRFSHEALSKLVEDQKFLARAAGHFVRPGGRLVYSTCSIEPRENGEVARWLARSEPPVRLVREELTLPAGAADPTAWHDGGYLAVFEVR